MNKQTQQIKELGYFFPFTTLGENGWSHVYTFSKGWKTYDLYHNPSRQVLDTIITSNETKAREVFKSRWSLYDGVHTIRLSRTQYFTG